MCQMQFFVLFRASLKVIADIKCMRRGWCVAHAYRNHRINFVSTVRGRERRCLWAEAMTFIAAHFVEKHKSGQRRSYLHCKNWLMGFTQTRAGAQEEGTSAIERGRKWTESGSRQDIPQKSGDYMVDDDDVQLCMGRGINQPKKAKQKSFQGGRWKCDVIFRCHHAEALRSCCKELSIRLPGVGLGCHLRSPPVPENVKRKHENINIEKHHASFPSELCYMRTQECEVCGARPGGTTRKTFYDRRSRDANKNFSRMESRFDRLSWTLTVCGLLEWVTAVTDRSLRDFNRFSLFFFFEWNSRIFFLLFLVVGSLCVLLP